MRKGDLGVGWPNRFKKGRTATRTSDDEVNEILQGFVLTPKIDGEINSTVSAGHSWFNCTCTCTSKNSYYMYVCTYVHVVHVLMNEPFALLKPVGSVHFLVIM